MAYAFVDNELQKKKEGFKHLVIRLSYFHNRISYTGKTTSFYLIST